MFTQKMFTRRNAVALVAMTCLLPIVSSAHDDDRDRDRDKDKDASVQVRVRSTRRITRSAIEAAARCNSRSTPGKAMKRAHAWARAFKNVT